MSNPSVYIIYGFAEGAWHGKLFRNELIKHGLVSTNEVSGADIIVAHSGGCFYLPDAKKGQLIVLINPPYWPGRSLFVSAWQTLWWNLEAYTKVKSASFWVKKTIWNVIYMFGSLRKTFWIARNARYRDFYLAIKKHETLIIRSSMDTWLTPQAPELISPHAKFEYREVRGHHDDCWLYPHRYVEVIKSVYDTRRSH
jgi:hypothetical protein